ncbi:MAG: hypothetical protein ACRYF4_12520 [Janthinobacterium lividum]
MMRRSLLTVAFLTCTAVSAQMPMDGKEAAAHKPAAVPSTQLVITGLTGKTRTLNAAELKTMPHVSVSVHNAHNNKDESYSGVPVKDLLATVESAKGDGPKVSANMLVIVAAATDGFHVALTLCDTSPECRSGQAIVADAQDGASLTADGAFKLILTEDKTPARWARNLQSLTVQAVPAN